MKTDHETIQSYLERARYYARLLMGNATYLQKEMSPMTMPDELRERLNSLCADLIDTKHDLFHEIFEIDELINSSPESPAIAANVQRIQEWMLTSVREFQEAVDEVQKAVEAKTAEFLLQMLMMQCAINILYMVPAPFVFEEDLESTHEEEDDDEEETNFDPSCYAFCSEDSYPIGKLVAAIGDIMQRPELSSEALESMKVFLFAMERLPLVTPGVRMSLALRSDWDGESDSIEIRMEDGEFSLCRGTWVDGDADTETVFEVTSDFRDGDAFMASQFADSFSDCAQDACREVVISNTSDEPFTGWDLEPKKGRWNGLSCSCL